jgi:hypothetical protein
LARNLQALAGDLAAMVRKRTVAYRNRDAETAAPFAAALG